MKKRLLGILLSFALMLTMMPVLGLSLTAYATSSTNYVLTFSVTGAEKPGSITTTLPCTLTKADWLKLAGLDPDLNVSGAHIATEDEKYLSLDSGSGSLSIKNPFEGSKSITQVDQFNHTVSITCEVIKEPVPYIDADGSKKSCTDYTVVEGSDTHVVWGEQNKTTWYVVNDNVTISDGVEIDGNVNLILCDGAKLTVVNGIYRGNYSLSITIYAQSTSGSMGSLESSSPFYAADVTINGGAINARGIEGTSVTINGGTVNTNGGTNRPGIYTESSTVTINGGEVYTESEKFYGIEGAYGNSTVTINGGTVTAIGVRQAIHGTLINAIAGTGWTNVEGTEGKTAIEVKEEGQTLDEKIKKVQFPAEVAPTPTPTPTPAPASNPLTVTTTAKTSARSMTVKWTWNNVPGAKSYKVSYHKVGSKKWTTKKTKKNKYVVKGHKMKGLYEYKVAAVTASGDVWSNTSCRYFKGVKTKAKAGKAAGTVRASWKKDKGATGYQVKLATNKKLNGAQVVNVSADKKSYTFSGLKSGKKYYVSVRPLKDYNGVTYQGIRCKALKVKAK